MVRRDGARRVLPISARRVLLIAVVVVLETVLCSLHSLALGHGGPPHPGPPDWHCGLAPTLGICIRCYYANVSATDAVTVDEASVTVGFADAICRHVVGIPI
jgi:hypothetical protein